MIEVIKIENGKKKLCLVANTEEDRDWLKSLGTDIKIELITENQSILGTSVTGALLLTQNEK